MVWDNWSNGRPSGCGSWRREVLVCYCRNFHFTSHCNLIIDFDCIQGRESPKKSWNGSHKGTQPMLYFLIDITIDDLTKSVFEGLDCHSKASIHVFVFVSCHFLVLLSKIRLVVIMNLLRRSSSSFFLGFCFITHLCSSMMWAGRKYDCTQGWNLFKAQKNLVCHGKGEKACCKCCKGSFYFHHFFS